MPLENNENKNNVFVQDDNIINKQIKSVPAPEKNIGVDTHQTIFDNIIEAGDHNVLDLSALESFTQVSQSRDQIYALMDMMSEDSIVASALELYTEDATEYNDKGQIVWCESSDSEVAHYIQFLLDSMNIDKNVYSQIHSLIKYGDLYLRLYRESDYVEDTLFDDVPEENKSNRQLLNEFLKNPEEKEPLHEDVLIKAYSKKDHYVHYIDRCSDPAEVFELTKFGKSYAYIKTDINSIQTQPVGSAINNVNRFNFQFNKNDVTLFDPTCFVHACLEDNSNRTPEEVSLFLSDAESDHNKLTQTVRRGQPLLYSVYKIWRLLKLLENSLVLNRVTKSSVVRVVQVEVGDMPKEMVGKNLQGIKSMMEQKSALKEGTSITEYTNPGPVENNIYVPTRNGIGGLNINAIGGDTNVTGLADIDYFKTLFYGALGIPKQYLGDTDDATGFNGGTALSIISSRYARRIKRIQNTYCQALTDAINLMLLDKGLKSYINKFTIRMQPPTTQEDISRKDAVAGEVQLVRDIMDLIPDSEQSKSFKLEILTELLANIVTEPEVISLLQEEIDRLKQENPDENTSTTSGEDESMDIEGDMNIDLSSDAGMDAALNLDNISDTEISDNVEGSSESSAEQISTLPNPDELGIGDLTDNNNVEI